MKPTKKLDLFIVTGASGSGKSTACEILHRNQKNYAVIESDIWWHDAFLNRNNNIDYRNRWLRMCASISQTGLPVVLCGCAVPENYEYLENRSLFNKIHYIALVCERDILEYKLKIGRGISDEKFISESLNFNKWFKENACKTEPKIELVDNSNLTSEQTASIIDKWINRILGKKKA